MTEQMKHPRKASETEDEPQGGHGAGREQARGRREGTAFARSERSPSTHGSRDPRKADERLDNAGRGIRTTRVPDDEEEDNSPFQDVDEDDALSKPIDERAQTKRNASKGDSSEQTWE